ncbi:MAG: hypothetical protein ACK6D7_03045, partial [Acidobacteriota bacterium]
NGLASAWQEGRVPRSLEPCLRGLCALLEHAHNGLASACALLGIFERFPRGEVHHVTLQNFAGGK